MYEHTTFEGLYKIYYKCILCCFIKSNAAHMHIVDFVPRQNQHFLHFEIAV